MNGARAYTCVYVRERERRKSNSRFWRKEEKSSPLFIYHTKEFSVKGERIRELKKCVVIQLVLLQKRATTILKEILSGQFGTSLPQPLGVVLVPRGVR